MDDYLFPWFLWTVFAFWVGFVVADDWEHEYTRVKNNVAWAEAACAPHEGVRELSFKIAKSVDCMNGTELETEK